MVGQMQEEVLVRRMKLRASIKAGIPTYLTPDETPTQIPPEALASRCFLVKILSRPLVNTDCDFQQLPFVRRKQSMPRANSRFESSYPHAKVLQKYEVRHNPSLENQEFYTSGINLGYPRHVGFKIPHIKIKYCDSIL